MRYRHLFLSIEIRKEKRLSSRLVNDKDLPRQQQRQLNSISPLDHERHLEGGCSADGGETKAVFFYATLLPHIMSHRDTRLPILIIMRYEK